MITKSFKITFLSDIVLNKSSNNEGNIESLDFITGSSILGIVAKYYKTFGNQAYKVFHSDEVLFGEATPLIGKTIFYKAPFSLFRPKGAENFEEVYNHHFLDLEDEQILNKQLKQIRSGFVSLNNKILTSLNYDYIQKAAYDNEKGKAKDSAMFGYRAIKKGMTWKFDIKFSDEKMIKDVVSKLLGKKHLGKSKTSAYGEVMIEEYNNPEPIKTFEPQSEYDYLYINSSLALFDQDGSFTTIPSIQNLGLSKGEIDFSKTQIRNKRITPFNGVRQQNDYTRLIIEKGSVIVLKDADKKELDKFKQKTIGAFINEGYGEIIVNPLFLKEEQVRLEKIELKTKFIKDDSYELDDTLINFLTKKKEQKNTIKTQSHNVFKFINECKRNATFKEISNSQWGQIRLILQVSKEYKKDIKDFIEHGSSKKQWSKYSKDFYTILEKENIDFMKLLSIHMPKVKWESENE